MVVKSIRERKSLPPRWQNEKPVMANPHRTTSRNCGTLCGMRAGDWAALARDSFRNAERCSYVTVKHRRALSRFSSNPALTLAANKSGPLVDAGERNLNLQLRQFQNGALAANYGTRAGLQKAVPSPDIPRLK